MAESKKYVLITGASSGIGKVSALMLAERGFKVFAGIRKETDAQELKSLNNNIIPIFIDVNEHCSVEKSFCEIAETVQDNGLYGLVNNAGIAVAGPLEFIPIEKLRFQFETNVIGQVKVIQTFLPLIRKAQGRIINISSVAGFTAVPFKAPYCASKHAFEAISDSLRMELSPWGITVCLVQPGIIKTNIWERSINLLQETINEMPEKAAEYYGAFQNLLIEKTMQKVEKKAIPPENVAEAVFKALNDKNPKTRYLVGNDATFLNFMKFLPDKIKDKCICSRTGMDKVNYCDK